MTAYSIAAWSFFFLSRDYNTLFIYIYIYAFQNPVLYHSPFAYSVVCSSAFQLCSNLDPQSSSMRRQILPRDCFFKSDVSAFKEQLGLDPSRPRAQFDTDFLVWLQVHHWFIHGMFHILQSHCIGRLGYRQRLTWQVSADGLLSILYVPLGRACLKLLAVVWSRCQPRGFALQDQQSPRSR